MKNRAYPLHALSLPDQFRSEKSVFRRCGDSNRSEIDSQVPAVPMPSFRNRWGQSGDVLGRLRLENHENLEICPSLSLLQIEHILCTRTASRTNFGVKNHFLENVVAAIDRESIARGPEDPCRHSGTGGGSRGRSGPPETRKS